MRINKFKFFISFVLLSFILVSCEKDEETNNDYLILGTWINTHVDEQLILTDDAFSIEFKSDNSKILSLGIQMNENNESWQENGDYTYSINENIISIDGSDMLGNSHSIELNIISIDDEKLIYSVQRFSLNGEIFPDTNIYEFKKVMGDFSSEFTGVWYGHCSDEGASDASYHYWEYFDNGSYNYYYQDENENWIKKSDNEGRYFLYGDLFVSNYTNDLVSGGTGMAYECWNFTINDNTMTWKGLRENNTTISYEMEKVSTPPETL